MTMLIPTMVAYLAAIAEERAVMRRLSSRAAITAANRATLMTALAVAHDHLARVSSPTALCSLGGHRLDGAHQAVATVLRQVAATEVLLDRGGTEDSCVAVDVLADPVVAITLADLAEAAELPARVELMVDLAVLIERSAGPRTTETLLRAARRLLRAAGRSRRRSRAEVARAVERGRGGVTAAQLAVDLAQLQLDGMPFMTHQPSWWRDTRIINGGESPAL